MVFSRRFSLLLLLVTVASAQARIQSKDYVSSFNEYYRTGKEVPRVERITASKYRFVFINGFFNEINLKSFRDLTALLETQGISKSAIHVIKPPSTNSVENNLSYVEAELKKISERGPEKLVLIGHSKGAAETLAVALAAPGWLSDRIQNIFLIQGAFDGSPLADFLLNEGAPIDDRLPLLVRLALTKLQSMDLASRLQNAERLIGFTVDQGLLSLTERATEAFWKTHLERYRDRVATVGDKTYYILGNQAPTGTRWAFTVPAYYMDVYYGANDGVIPVKHQMLREIESPLVNLKMDHVDLVSEAPKTKTAVALRSAFAKALLTAVAQDERSR